MSDSKIDFVVTWVDDGDLKWRKERDQYLPDSDNILKMNQNSRYRDFNIFKYWFRSVEKYAPWVNHIFLITNGQVPKWLNVKNPKLRLINHRDYIDSDFLPTFNSNAIELGINKIKDLSDRFVLFNDDTFINDYVSERDFFLNKTPKDTYIESPIIATKDSVDHIMVNDMELINAYFNKRDFYKHNLTKVFNPRIGAKLLRTIALLPSKNFSGIWNSHLPVPYNKRTFDEVWQIFGNEISDTLTHRFRSPYDYSQWLMRYWQLVSGDYSLQKKNFGKVYNLTANNIKDAVQNIEKKEHKVICLNDNDSLVNMHLVKSKLVNAYENKLKTKSDFEI